jgi:hypothetical protein
MHVHTAIIRQMTLARQQESQAAAARGRLARQACRARHAAPEAAPPATRERCPRAVPA